MAAGGRFLSCLLAVLSASLTPGYGGYQQIVLTQAPGVTCDMSSRYDNQDLGCWGALNGRTSTEYNRQNCVYTDKKVDDYWLVNLGQPRNIHRIIIYPETGWDLMRNIIVLVDNTEIFRFPLDKQITDTLRITGGQLPRRGRFIRLTKSSGYVTLCELQVDECTADTYGANCTLPCGDGCNENGGIRTCDSINGTCFEGCQDGWLRPQCDKQCPQECKVPCDTNTGNCPECKGNFILPDCRHLQSSDVQCNMSSIYDHFMWGRSMDCDGAIDENTDTVWKNTSDDNPSCVCTVDGRNEYWLLNLGKQYNIHRVTIYPETGSNYMGHTSVLVDDIEIFWFPPLPVSEKITNAQRITGGQLPRRGRFIRLTKRWDYVTLCELQVDECTVNSHGVFCTEACSPGCLTNGDSTTCDSISGNCTQGCFSGYYGGQCDSSCGKGCVDNNCSRQDGACTCLIGWSAPNCTECDSGYYGVESCEECGYCRDDDVCNNTNGHCPRGCRDGYDGDRCDKCGGSWWGSNCSLACDQCDGDGSCDMDTGRCINGCISGFGGDTCTHCTSGWWGSNCSLPCQCAGDGSCDMDTGHCIEKGDETPGSDDNTIYYIAGGVVAAVVLLAVLGAVFFLRRRKRIAKESDAADRGIQHSDSVPSTQFTGVTAVGEMKADFSSEITPVRDVTEGDKPETKTPGNESNYAQLETYENPDDIRPYSVLQDGGKLPIYRNIQSDQETALYQNTTVYKN